MIRIVSKTKPYIGPVGRLKGQTLAGAAAPLPLYVPAPPKSPRPKPARKRPPF